MAVPKSYSNFKRENITDLGLEIKLRLFLINIPKVEPSDYLKMTMVAHLRQPLLSEKAKSEFLIAPILFEIADKHRDRISFFSGHNLDVDKSLGLKGFCDFIFTRVPESTDIQEPIFCLVEAKNDNLEKGVPQCIAEMYAAQILNAAKKKELSAIYGCVTTGHLWQFLKLENSTVYQDTTIYGLSELPQILGVLHHFVED
jgi:hypothetical protein